MTSRNVSFPAVPSADRDRHRRMWMGNGRRTQARARGLPTVQGVETQPASLGRWTGGIQGVQVGDTITVVTASVGTGTSRYDDMAPAPSTPDHPYKDKYPAPWRLHSNPRTSYRVGHNLCCGVKEVHGIQNLWAFYDPSGEGRIRQEKQTVNDMVTAMRDTLREAFKGRGRPYVVFTDNDPKLSPGEDFAKYIEANDYGKVMRSGYHYNENSGNKVQVYFWTLDKDFSFLKG